MVTTDVKDGQKTDAGPTLAPDRSVVLVVDDDPDTRKLVSLMLAGQYAVLEAEDGEQCLRSLARSAHFGPAEGGISLVLLDIMMPGTDGLTLCRRIVKEFGVIVIMMTARSMRADVETAIRNGARDYMVKPFTKTTLLAKVSKHLYALSHG
ncbi:MAG: response regulator [Anaerolineae bacterium]|nr:response regulator [Anaerolineae bacterium]